MSFVEPREYRPDLLPRRGEWNAWALTLLTGVLLVPLRMALGVVPVLAWVLWAVLLLSALTISLGNWADRHTVLRLEAGGLFYSNGLRRVRLPWEDVQKLVVFTDRLGQQAQVVGARSRFGFRLLSTMTYPAGSSARFGFARGQEIVETIVAAAGLSRRQEDGGGVIYSRP